MEASDEARCCVLGGTIMYNSVCYLHGDNLGESYGKPAVADLQAASDSEGT